MGTVHQAKIVLGYHSEDIPEDIVSTCEFEEKFEGKYYSFSTCTEGDIFGVTLQCTDWAEVLNNEKLIQAMSPEFIAFVKKECDTELEPKIFLAWDKY